ncbi:MULTISPECIES: ABC transporter ATP-binding protein [Acinetobacter]|uniref:Putative sugar transport protein (ABC superfamily atp_bind) n=1 Tax=Acinetobacter baylyi (strain ATCC 33305 / BD413 / ADP1) TaxID=62977 RepID=Q6FFI2_ACIAD|nr:MULTISPECIES: ABC transporter ATP-binding protein [Acinetobacter]KAF2371927.1 ABC transporter [Acinetobacter baylyi]KAF2372399.1 ABC transporter [Acinetobacter baylyi]KAF2378218.1 ABC transporter [Acinetobacter baylyi]KAF2380744.1 ABC transporter [Acinetobacter baylyi]KAF2382994.1 ABC transporter [Acinetobacter baylyi]
MMTTNTEYAPYRLELVNITKRYGGLVANDHISLKVAAGEIHAVLGENGAGKSTLMKIIYGAVKADEGEIVWNGRSVTVDSPAAARRLGIGMVYQHFSLFETLTVVENIALGLEEKFDLAHLAQRVVEVSEKYGLPIDPQRMVHSLSVGERQRVEIVRCLLQNPSLLILDEPTSVLTPQAVQVLFQTLRRLASEGVSILYISHKLNEIQSLCDTATILRGGQVTGTAIPKQETTASLAKMMIGRDLPAYQQHAYEGVQQPIFQVKQLSIPAQDMFGTSLKEINLSVNTGEILGIAGISGNGQAELLTALSGETTSLKESFWLDGQAIGHLHAGQRRKLGFGFVPEERLGRGAVPAMSLTENTLLTAFRMGMTRWGLVNYAKASAFAQACISKFGVKASGSDAAARSLSGGNLQKFIVGREIMQQPKVMVVAQPTWGVDVGASAFIRQTLIDLSRQGVAIVVISEELEELFEISDRIAVLAAGQLSPPQPVNETNAEQIGLLMSGLQRDSQPQEDVIRVSI